MVQESEQFSTLLSLPDYNSFVTERLVNSETRKGNIDDTLSFSTIFEQLNSQAEYFSSFLKDLSSYMNGNIMLVLRSLQLASNNFAHILEEHSTLKIELGNKDAHNRAQESEVLSLQKELRAMSSKCIYCIQKIKIIFDDVVDLGYAIELATGRSSTRSELEITVSDLMDEDADDYNKVADALLSTITILKSKSEELSAIKGCVITALDEFKVRLKQAESATEIAAHDHQLLLERACMLEKELETLQDECNRMELKMQEYQEREGTLKARELELLSLEHTQITTDRGKIVLNYNRIFFYSLCSFGSKLILLLSILLNYFSSKIQA